MSTIVNALPLLAFLALAIGITVAGSMYLRQGERHLEELRGRILFYEMRLGKWYHAHRSNT